MIFIREILVVVFSFSLSCYLQCVLPLEHQESKYTHPPQHVKASADNSRKLTLCCLALSRQHSFREFCVEKEKQPRESDCCSNEVFLLPPTCCVPNCKENDEKPCPPLATSWVWKKRPKLWFHLLCVPNKDQRRDFPPSSLSLSVYLSCLYMSVCVSVCISVSLAPFCVEEPVVHTQNIIASVILVLTGKWRNPISQLTPYGDPRRVWN